MTTQYSPILKLALPVQGELSGTWGDVVNDNITSMVEQAIAGRAVINTWSTNSHTLTSANGTTSESRCAMLELTDTGTALSGAGTVICPALSKIYIVKNAAGQNITVKTASGTGILVPNGRTTFLFCDGTNVVEALTHTTSLQLGTSTTVTAVLDEDNMASDSATSLATQQSIKAYVDSKVGQFDSLAEVLAVGNTTGSNDIIVDNGQKITTNTIDETTAGSGVTIDSVLLKDDVVNATDVETGSISANDGTTAATIANSTGVVTVPSAVLTTADINGGTADGVVIGGTTPAAATVTTATANTSLNIAGTVTVTSVLDEDNMASDDPAGLATQQSIKAYVDAQVGANNELSEVLANGNTTGGNDIVFSAGDNITNVSGNFAIDVDGDIELNADGSTIVLKDNTLARFTFNLDSTPSLQVGGTSLEIETTTDNSDILFKGSDGGSAITALTLDMSEAGAATFNSGVTLSGDLTVDTDTLYVDSTNNRVGINDASPSYTLDLKRTDAAGGYAYLGASSDGGSRGLIFTSSDNGSYLGAVHEIDASSSGGQIALSTGNSEAIRIDSSQRVLIGGGTNVSSATVQVSKTTGGVNVDNLMYANSANSPVVRMSKTRSATIGTVGTVVQAADFLGLLGFNGDDGTDIQTNAGYIAMQVDGTPGSNDMPGRLIFATTPDGSSSASERMRIDNEGRVSVGTGSGTGAYKLLSITSDGQSPTNASSARPALVLTSSQTAAVDVGPSLMLRGKTGNTTAEYSFGAIQGVKGSATAQDYSGSLVFYTQVSGGATLLSEAMRIDSSQRVMVGTATNIPITNASLQFEVVGDTNDSGAGGVGIARFGGGSTLALGGSPRSTTTGSFVVVQNNDNLGNIFFSGDDGTDLRSVAARISADVDGTPGANDMPGRLEFYTTSDGASSATERMRINNAGKVRIGSGDPSVNLEVVGSGDQFIFLQTSTSSDGLYIKADSGGDGTEFQTAGGQDKFGFRTNGTLAATIDSSQRVLIGHTSSIPNGGDNQSLQVTGTGSSDGISLARFNTTYGAYFTIGRSGSGTIGTYTAVPNNDEIGRIQWAVADGTDMSSVGAMINAVTEQQAASNDVPSRLVFSTTADGAQSPTERMRINSAGDVKIGTGGTPETKLQVQGGSIENGTILMGANYNGTGMNQNSEKAGALHHPVYVSDTSPKGYRLIGGYADSTRNMVQIGGGTNSAKAATQIVLYIGASATASSNTEAMRIDSSQRVIIGSGGSVPTKWWNSTSYGSLFGVENNNQNTAAHYVTGGFIRNTADSEGPQIGLGKSRGTTSGAVTILQANDTVGLITAQGADGTNLVEATRIWTQVDGTPGADDMPGRLIFSTTSDGSQSPTERMRISNSGFVGVNRTDLSYYFEVDSVSMSPAARFHRYTDGNSRTLIIFRSSSNGSTVGGISINNSSAAFNTSSDYRLKENVVDLTGATTRLKQLEPKRFNFIADADTTVDGFLAHEVQSVIPEAITGTHNEVDDDGNPVYQGIDQSKLVPLLVATIKELEARITALENA